MGKGISSAPRRQYNFRTRVNQVGRKPKRRSRLERRGFGTGRAVRYGEESRQTWNSRNARASRMAATTAERQARMRRYEHVLGSYAEQFGAGARRVNRGRRHPLAIEVDHIPTDGSQRGDLARDAKANRIPTLTRAAVALPKYWHRWHPTTSGGHAVNEVFRNEQKEWVQGLRAGSKQVAGSAYTGHAAGMAMHLEAYRPIVQRRGKGVNVHRGVIENAHLAIAHAHSRGEITATDATHLKGGACCE